MLVLSTLSEPLLKQLISVLERCHGHESPARLGAGARSSPYALFVYAVYTLLWRGHVSRREHNGILDKAKTERPEDDAGSQSEASYSMLMLCFPPFSALGIGTTM
jgi:hypothetical protein